MRKLCSFSGNRRIKYSSNEFQSLSEGSGLKIQSFRKMDCSGVIHGPPVAFVVKFTIQMLKIPYQ